MQAQAARAWGLHSNPQVLRSPGPGPHAEPRQRPHSPGDRGTGHRATLTLQKTVGRNQIHRIHGFPHLGTVPKTCVSDTPSPSRLWPTQGPLAPTGPAPRSPALPPRPLCPAPHQARRVNSISKQQMEKCISQERRGGGSEWRAGCTGLFSIPFSHRVLVFPLFGSARRGPWGAGTVLPPTRPEERRPALCPRRA